MGGRRQTINAGFSLVEVMISLLVLLVGVMGLAVAFQRNIYQTNASKNDSQAMLLAYAIVDELEAQDFNTIQTNLTSILANYTPGFQGEEGGGFFVPEVNIIEATPNLIRLEVLVNWTGSNTEVAEGGYGKDTAASAAYSLNTVLSKQYGDELMAGPAAGGAGP